MDAYPARLWQVILGHLASLERLVPHGRLQMRSLPVPLPWEVKRDLSWWMVRDHLLTGVRLRTPAPDLHLYSDASCSGWGAHLLDQHVVGPGKVVTHQFSRDEGSVPGPSGVLRRCHRSSRDSNVRQLDGRGVRQQARGHGFLGPMLVGQPPSEMDREFRRPSRCEVSSRTRQCPGRSPQPSRASCRDRVVSSPSGGEVTASCLGQSVDRPLCDVPQRETAPVLLACPGSPGRLRGCVSSSFPLIGRVVAHVRESSRLAMTLVAPLWPEKEWFADLLLLLTQPPLALPWWDSLLRQPHCNLFHQGVHALNLHAWRLSSITSESRAFREGLLESCQGVSDPPPHASTSRGGRSSVVGVVEGALLQSTPLFQ